MEPLRFIYQDAKGQVREWHLVRWHEHREHIQGRSDRDTLPRTFCKERVQEYLAGAEQLQGDLAPPLPRPAPRAPKDDRPQILFTGFRKADRERLEQLADQQGLHVVKTPTAQLAYLCSGYNPGPTKVLAAREKGAFILSEEQLLRLFETGEVPDLTTTEGAPD